MFQNASLSPEDAQGIAYESEVVADAQGFARVTETAKWARNKIRPLRNELLAVWSFEKTDDRYWRSLQWTLKK